MGRRVSISIVLFVLSMSAATANAQYDIKPGIFNWWRAKAVGSPWSHKDHFASDQAGTNNDATIEGAPTTSYTHPGGVPTGITCFPKVTDSLVVANHPDIDIGSEDFTIKGTFSLDPAATPQDIVTILDKRKAINGRHFGYAVFLYKNRFSFQMANGITGDVGAMNYFAPTAGDYRNGERHTFVVSVKREPNGGRIWVDGTLVLTFSPVTGYLFNEAPLRFARHAIHASGPLLGCLYEIQMYRYVAYTWDDLDHQRWTCHPYDEGVWFRFDEGASDYAFDSVGTMENPRRAKDKPGVCTGRVRGGAHFVTDVSLRPPSSSPTQNLGTGDFFIAAWVRIPPGTAGRRNIVFKGTPGTGKGYALSFVDGAVVFEMNSVKVSATPASGTLANDEWHLIGVSVRRKQSPSGELMILSEQIATPIVKKFAPDMTSVDSSQMMIIGGGFRGCLDELMIIKGESLPLERFERMRKFALDTQGLGSLNYGCY